MKHELSLDTGAPQISQVNEVITRVHCGLGGSGRFAMKNF
jgi:hypothetical protein